MTVLIIAENPEFSRDVVSRWQTQRSVPTFTVVSSTVWQGSPRSPGASSTMLADGEAISPENGIPGQFELVIIAPMAPVRVNQLLKALEPCGAPAVVVTTELTQRWREEFPWVITIRQNEGWLDALVLLAGEVLRRLEASARARQAEESAAVAHRHATLGRYMLEMRHSLNNALTSVLGNAELILLEPGALSADVRGQITTIHSMALRMHEILQRFSSLDAELHFAEKQSQDEKQARTHAVGSPL